MPNPVSNEFLENRVKALHNRLAATVLSSRGLEATAARLGQSLKWSTVSVVETTLDGRAVRIVTTNDAQLYKLIQQNRQKWLLPGEILGSRPTYVYGPKEPKKRPPRQAIHAEQLGVNDAKKMGATSGRIATSNLGCTDQCVALLKEEFPGFQHINPAATSPDPHLLTGLADSNVTHLSAHPSTASSSVSHTISGLPTTKDRLTSARYLNTDTTVNINKLPEGSIASREANQIFHAASAEKALSAAHHGARARALAVGVKAWKTARRVGEILVLCFVPLTALDIVIEVAFALWDREREKEEKKRREKQKALEAAFKYGGGQKVQQLIQTKILNNTPLFEEHVRGWGINRRSNGFLYARLSAEILIERYRNPMNAESESLTHYKVVSLDVLSTTYMHEFEFSDIGKEKEVDKTDDDNQRLLNKGILPQTVRKFVQRKRLKYTIVPPIYTPFDIVISKINNLFLDIVTLVLECGGTGQFAGFDYKVPYDEQFETALQFPGMLNESTGRYCLSYLHWAAGLLSEHPLKQEDLEGNLEDPRKGWQRRFWLLNDVLEARRTKQKKNFSFMVEKLRDLVRAGRGNEQLRSAIIDLYAGARVIWYDLSRIESDIGKSEYYFLGPGYKPPS